MGDRRRPDDATRPGAVLTPEEDRWRRRHAPALADVVRRLDALDDAAEEELTPGGDWLRKCLRMSREWAAVVTVEDVARQAVPDDL